MGYVDLRSRNASGVRMSHGEIEVGDQIFLFSHARTQRGLGDSVAKVEIVTQVAESDERENPTCNSYHEFE